MFTMLMCRDIEQQNYMYKSTTKFSNRNKMAITCLSVHVPHYKTCNSIVIVIILKLNSTWL